MHCSKCGTLAPQSTELEHCTVCGSYAASNTEPLNLSHDSTDIPWEQSGALGLGAAFIKTVHLSLLKPTTFFTKISSKSNLFYALLFALLASSIGALGDLLWNKAFTAIGNAATLQNYEFMQLFNASTLVFYPLSTILGVGATTCYIYALLYISKSNSANLSTTCCVVCYSQSALILQCIPFIGPAIAPIWALLILIVGISSVHHISKLRAGMTIILPFLLLMVLVLFCLIFFIGGTLLSTSILKEILPLFR